MVRVGGLLIVHKWFVVRDVVSGVYDRIVASQARVMLAAYGASLGVHACWCEATLKPSPSDALGVEKIADVFAGHGDLVHGLKLGIRCDAVIKQGRGSPITAPVVAPFAMLPLAEAGFPFGRSAAS